MLKPCEKEDCKKFETVSRDMALAGGMPWSIEGTCLFCKHFKPFDLYEKGGDDEE